MNDQTHTPFPVIIEGQIGAATVQTVNARDLHRALEVGKDFSTWIRDRISQFNFSENSDFVCSPISGSEGRGGHNKLDYHLTIDMAKELAMVERNKAGKRVRQYFIECERKLKAKPLADVMALAALNDPAAMRGILLTYTEKVIALQAENAALSPKANAHDRIAESFGSTCRRIAAKNLGIPPLVLNRWMRTNGWTYQIHGTKDDIAYQSKISAGYLEHKVETGEKPDGTTWTRTSVRVTPKGMLALAKAFPPAAAEVPNTSKRSAVAGLGAMMVAAVASLASPQPVKAATAPVANIRDGLALMQIGGKSILVDTNRYRPEPGVKFVTARPSAPLAVEEVKFDKYGGAHFSRKGLGAPRQPTSGEHKGAMNIQDSVMVIGAVVSVA